tara:strand:+ start:16868 stop:17137 length:270 start_codon:yes stop_codon:yes gene_type:complete
MRNYVVCGKLEVKGNITITGTIYDVQNMSALITKLAEGNYRNIMELTNDERKVDSLELDNIVIISFDCDDVSELVVLGSVVSMNTDVLT